MSQGITVQPGQVIERILTLELVRVTERAAVAAARLRGHGNEKAADQAAVDAMRRELNRLQIDGTVVIGEGERDEAPMLFIGERVGNRAGPKVDIAVDPLEGTTLCAKDMPGSIAVMAMAEAGTLLAAHGVDRRLIGRLLVAAAAQPGRGDGGALGHAHELERQDALDDLAGLDGDGGVGRWGHGRFRSLLANGAWPMTKGARTRCGGA